MEQIPNEEIETLTTDTCMDGREAPLKSRKMLVVELKDQACRQPFLGIDDFPNIYVDHKVTLDEANEALDILATYFMQYDLYKVTCDLTERNISKAPEQEVTMAEVEEKFGSRIRIKREE